MSIQHPPQRGSIILCDFGQDSFKPPEMAKRRPVVVLSRRRRNHASLATVVPLSTSAPNRRLPYVVELHFAEPLNQHFAAPIMWAKCDVVTTVAFKRLDLFRGNRDPETGQRSYKSILLEDDQLTAVVRGVLEAIGAAD